MLNVIVTTGQPFSILKCVEKITRILENTDLNLWPLVDIFLEFMKYKKYLSKRESLYWKSA